MIEADPDSWPLCCLVASRLPRFWPMLHTALNIILQIMSMGKLLADLPSEVRVHIFCLALGLTTSGALLRHSFNLALVSESLQSVWV